MWSPWVGPCLDSLAPRIRVNADSPVTKIRNWKEKNAPIFTRGDGLHDYTLRRDYTALERTFTPSPFTLSLAPFTLVALEVFFARPSLLFHHFNLLSSTSSFLFSLFLPSPSSSSSLSPSLSLPLPLYQTLSSSSSSSSLSAHSLADPLSQSHSSQPPASSVDVNPSTSQRQPVESPLKALTRLGPLKFPKIPPRRRASKSHLPLHRPQTNQAKRPPTIPVLSCLTCSLPS